MLHSFARERILKIAKYFFLIAMLFSLLTLTPNVKSCMRWTDLNFVFSWLGKILLLRFLTSTCQWKPLSFRNKKLWALLLFVHVEIFHIQAGGDYLLQNIFNFKAMPHDNRSFGFKIFTSCCCILPNSENIIKDV